MTHQEWVRCATFDVLVNATMAQAFLEAEGIPSYMENEYTQPIRHGAATTFHLLVPASRLARARDLCENLLSGDDLAQEAERQWREAADKGPDRTAE